jgi:hypothetical protein
VIARKKKEEVRRSPGGREGGRGEESAYLSHEV